MPSDYFADVFQIRNGLPYDTARQALKKLEGNDSVMFLEWNGGGYYVGFNRTHVAQIFEGFLRESRVDATRVYYTPNWGVAEIFGEPSIYHRERRNAR